jgi:hypothetical protein
VAGQQAPRPRLVTLLGWMLIALGAIECVYRLTMIRWPLHAEDVGVPLFELIILVCGIFLLRGCDWARWLAVAWVGFHIVVGSLHSLSRGILHGLIFLAFVWMIFRPAMNAWFRPQKRAGSAGAQG